MRVGRFFKQENAVPVFPLYLFFGGKVHFGMPEKAVLSIKQRVDVTVGDFSCLKAHQGGKHALL